MGNFLQGQSTSSGRMLVKFIARGTGLGRRDGRLPARRAGRGAAAGRGRRGPSRRSGTGGGRRRLAGVRAHIEAAKLRTGLEHEADARELIRDYLTQRVEHGTVRRRADCRRRPGGSPP